MRWISGIVFLVIVTGWVAYHLDDSATAVDNQTVPTIWRHTVNGWEKLSGVYDQNIHPAAIVDLWKAHPHPLVVALLVGLMSLMALVAFSPEKRATRKPSPYEKVIPTSGELELRSRNWVAPENLPESNPAP